MLQIRFVCLILAAISSCHALTTAAAGAATVPDTIEQRVKACAACHGKLGEGGRGKHELYPRLAGKPAGYLYNQLLNFRERRRHSEVMSYMVAFLSNDFLHEIAAYYSHLTAPYPSPAVGASKAALTRGETLVTKGDSSIDVPACAACHGEALTGMEPAIPGLIGLSPYYIGQQLGAWRARTRAAAEPDCMARVASLLGPGDISAVTAYLASQPPPTKPPPKVTSSTRVPMECGSLTQH
jgi:cytochrome c553